MVFGLARCIKTENCSIRFSILDIDKVLAAPDTKLFDLVAEMERRVTSPTNGNDDLKFRYKGGVVYTSADWLPTTP